MLMGFGFPASWGRAFSWAFLLVGQSALCLLVGRLLEFLQLFAVIQSCRGKYFINVQVSYPLFFHFFYKASGFLFFLSRHVYWTIVILSGESFVFFFFVIPVSGVC